MSPPSSRSKCEFIKNQHVTGSKKIVDFCLFLVGFLRGLLFEPEDGGDLFLRNVGLFSPDTRRYVPEDGSFELF
jgi:hypothetical protein